MLYNQGHYLTPEINSHTYPQESIHSHRLTNSKANEQIWLNTNTIKITVKQRERTGWGWMKQMHGTYREWVVTGAGDVLTSWGVISWPKKEYASFSSLSLPCITPSQQHRSILSRRKKTREKMILLRVRCVEIKRILKILWEKLLFKCI